MYYKEFLRARGAFVIFVIVGGVLLVLSLVGMAIVPHGNGNMAAAAWPEMLVTAALFASIMATVLGSTLSQENDGHLELACTKPCSRTTYATTMITVDMAAILLAQLAAVAFILIHYVIGHGITHFVAGPDAAANAVRFLLFPLAWYAVIAGLSAGLRGKAGVVQGLIWPVATILVVLRLAPLSGIWHNMFVAVNVINPLMLVSYHQGEVTIVGPTSLPVVASAVMMAVLVIAGWAAAIMQWRRVEA
jgi:hypothetical protein